MKLRLFAPLVAAALLAPGLASALGTIEGFYGIAKPPGTSFRGAVNDPDVFDDSLQIAGGNVLINLGTFEFGAIADITWAEDSATQTAIGALAGLKLPIGPLRLDLLGEFGGHRYGNLAKDPDIVRAGSDQWLAYVGLRPGVAFKFGAPSAPGFILGVWGFARWDLESKRVPVTIDGAPDTPPSSVKLGGSTYGATVRAGFEF